MRELITDLLDTVALLLLAAGFGFMVAGAIALAAIGDRGYGPVSTGGGLLSAGVIVLGGSWLAARRGDPR